MTTQELLQDKNAFEVLVASLGLEVHATDLLQEKLLQSDLTSVFEIADYERDRFLQRYGEVFGGWAGDIHGAARRETVQAAWQLIESAIHPAPSTLSAAFAPTADGDAAWLAQLSVGVAQEQLPLYRQLFGEAWEERCVPGAIESWDSPIAYWLHLLGMIERFGTKAEASEAQAAIWELGKRRSDLQALMLSDVSAGAEVPTLELVNRIVEKAIVEAGKEQSHEAFYEALADTRYPASLPFHLPLTQITLALKEKNTSLGEVIRQLDHTYPHFLSEDSIRDGRKALFGYLGFSPEQQSLLLERGTIDTARHYGALKVQLSANNIEVNAEEFCRAAGLLRVELDQLLCRAEYAVVGEPWYGCRYINYRGATAEPVHLDERGVLKCSVQTFGCISRIIRLKRWLDLPFDQVDTLIVKCAEAQGLGASWDKEIAITEHSLRAIGLFRYLQQHYQVEPQMFASFLGSLPRGAVGTQLPFFDQLFNPIGRIQARVEHDPKAFFDYNAPVGSPGAGLMNRLCAGVGINQETFIRLASTITQIRGYEPHQLRQSADDYASLYRLARIPRLFGLKPEEGLLLLNLIGARAAIEVLANSAVIGAQDDAPVAPDTVDVIFALESAVRWLKDIHLSVSALAQLVSATVPPLTDTTPLTQFAEMIRQPLAQVMLSPQHFMAAGVKAEYTDVLQLDLRPLEQRMLGAIRLSAQERQGLTSSNPYPQILLVIAKNEKGELAGKVHGDDSSTLPPWLTTTKHAYVIPPQEHVKVDEGSAEGYESVSIVCFPRGGKSDSSNHSQEGVEIKLQARSVHVPKSDSYAESDNSVSQASWPRNIFELSYQAENVKFDKSVSCYAGVLTVRPSVSPSGPGFTEWQFSIEIYPSDGSPSSMASLMTLNPDIERYNALRVDTAYDHTTVDLEKFCAASGLLSWQVKHLLCVQDFKARASENCKAINEILLPGTASTLASTLFPSSWHYGVAYIHGGGPHDIYIAGYDIRCSAYNLERVRRMITLQKMVEIPYDKLDWLIASSARAEGERNLGIQINQNTFRVLGLFCHLRDRYTLEPEAFAAFFQDISPFACGEETPFFDRVFNADEASVKEPLIVDWKAQYDYRVKSNETIKKLCTALHIEFAFFEKIAESVSKSQGLIDPQIYSRLSVFSALYRLVAIPRMLGITPEEGITLLAYLTQQTKSKTGYIELLASAPVLKSDPQGWDILDVILLLETTTSWIKRNNFSVEQFCQSELPLDLKPQRRIEWSTLLQPLVDDSGLIRPLSGRDENQVLRERLTAICDQAFWNDPDYPRQGPQQLNQLVDIVQRVRAEQEGVAISAVTQACDIPLNLAPQLIRWSGTSTYQILRQVAQLPAPNVGQALKATDVPASYIDLVYQLMRHATVIRHLGLSAQALTTWLAHPEWFGSEPGQTELSLSALYALSRYAHLVTRSQTSEDKVLHYLALTNEATISVLGESTRKLAELIQWESDELRSLVSLLPGNQVEVSGTIKDKSLQRITLQYRICGSSWSAEIHPLWTSKGDEHHFSYLIVEPQPGYEYEVSITAQDKVGKRVQATRRFSVPNTLGEDEPQQVKDRKEVAYAEGGTKLEWCKFGQSAYIYPVRYVEILGKMSRAGSWRLWLTSDSGVFSKAYLGAFLFDTSSDGLFRIVYSLENMEPDSLSYSVSMLEVNPEYYAIKVSVMAENDTSEYVDRKELTFKVLDAEVLQIKSANFISNKELKLFSESYGRAYVGSHFVGVYQGNGGAIAHGKIEAEALLDPYEEDYEKIPLIQLDKAVNWDTTYTLKVWTGGPDWDTSQNAVTTEPYELKTPKEPAQITIESGEFTSVQDLKLVVTTKNTEGKTIQVAIRQNVGGAVIAQAVFDLEKGVAHLDQALAEDTQYGVYLYIGASMEKAEVSAGVPAGLKTPYLPPEVEITSATFISTTELSITLDARNVRDNIWIGVYKSSGGGYAITHGAFGQDKVTGFTGLDYETDYMLQVLIGKTWNTTNIYLGKRAAKTPAKPITYLNQDEVFKVLNLTAGSGSDFNRVGKGITFTYQVTVEAKRDLEGAGFDFGLPEGLEKAGMPRVPTASEPREDENRPQNCLNKNWDGKKEKALFAQGKHPLKLMKGQTFTLEIPVKVITTLERKVQCAVRAYTYDPQVVLNCQSNTHVLLLDQGPSVAWGQGSSSGTWHDKAFTVDGLTNRGAARKVQALHKRRQSAEDKWETLSAAIKVDVTGTFTLELNASDSWDETEADNPHQVKFVLAAGDSESQAESPVQEFYIDRTAPIIDWVTPQNDQPIQLKSARDIPEIDWLIRVRELGRQTGLSTTALCRAARLSANAPFNDWRAVGEEIIAAVSEENKRYKPDQAANPHCRARKGSWSRDE
ncbi:Tc toxin subunit A [Pseudomonas batumici]|uniref:Tc toxin subunit A n=1 Tax=Pseudomonas batumici TaxID=226910 RepID=UPI0030D1B927